MNVLKNTLLACGILAGLSSLAQAAVIYDNGPLHEYNEAGRDYGGNDVSVWLQAEDFTLSSDNAVNGAGLYVAGHDGIDTWYGGVSYSILSDSAGKPGSTLVSGIGQNITATDTGIGWYLGGDIFAIDFDFETTFDALANEIYWLVLDLGDDSQRDNIYWIHADPNSSSPGYEQYKFDDSAWLSNPQQHAFSLYGKPSAVAVPAPATLLLFGVGLIGLAACRRRA